MAVFASCGTGRSHELAQSNKSLPYHGFHNVTSKTLPNGTLVSDTAYYTIPKFSFVNQDSAEISHHNYNGKPFVADFFFTTCPTICPIMSSQMARLQEKVSQADLNDEVNFLSHSINPKHDTPEVLKAYAEKMGADLANWNFITGEEEDIYFQARSGYMVSALEADTAAGGFIHSDNFVLIDKEMHIRGYYDGTDTESVDDLFADIKTLLNE